MSSFNPFDIKAAPVELNDAATAAGVVAPVLEAAANIPSTAPAANVDEILADVDTGKKGKKTKKDGGERKERAKNPTITKAQKAEIVKRYANESPAEIAASFGFEPRQVYNVVRNTRLLLEKALEEAVSAEDPTKADPAKAELIREKLKLIPHKENVGGSSGPRQNTLSVDDILNMI
jgi:transposase-like protein